MGNESPSCCKAAQEKIESLEETLNIMSDPATMADLAQADRDIANGDLALVDPSIMDRRAKVAVDEMIRDSAAMAREAYEQAQELLKAARDATDQMPVGDDKVACYLAVFEAQLRVSALVA